MKYIVILGDGMADEPISELGGKTPLAFADTPVMDSLAGMGEMGMVQNVPQGMAPGSDVANLSVMGYDPAACYSGRSPLEALSVGVRMEPDDIVFRCNLVTLTEKGTAAVKECDRIFERVSTRMLQGFSEEEQDQLLIFRQRMLDNLIKKDHSSCKQEG